MAIFGLVGRKLGHSWSVPIHNALGRGEYTLIELEPSELGEFFARADIGGLNVTIPYKRDAMRFCAELAESARLVGSVNTIVKTERGLVGHNTDAAGLLYAAEQAGIAMTGRKVLIFGSGGASLAAIAAAKMQNAREIVVISRSGGDGRNYESLARHAHDDAEIVINATPVGMYPNNGVAPADIALFPNLRGAIDLIYNPIRTAFLLRAKELGVPCTGGLAMLVAQAAESEKLFTAENGGKAPAKSEDFFTTENFIAAKRDGRAQAAESEKLFAMENGGKASANSEDFFTTENFVAAERDEQAQAAESEKLFAAEFDEQARAADASSGQTQSTNASDGKAPAKSEDFFTTAKFVATERSGQARAADATSEQKMRDGRVPAKSEVFFTTENFVAAERDEQAQAAESEKLFAMERDEQARVADATSGKAQAADVIGEQKMRDTISAITRKLRRDMMNIVLIGMPGSGKSTVGRELAKLANRTVIDIDAEIVKAAGKSIADIFAQDGEAAFRKRERKATAAAGKENGKIIVTGGGVVKDVANYAPLYQNGYICHIERDIELLARDGRPLSMRADLAKMYAERLPMYARFRNVIVANDAAPYETAETVWRNFCEFCEDTDY